MNKKRNIIISIIIFLLLIGGIVTYYLLQNKDKNTNTKEDKEAQYLQISNGLKDVIAATPDPFHIIPYLNENIKKVDKITADDMINRAISVNKLYPNIDNTAELTSLLEKKYPNGAYAVVDSLNTLTGITDTEVINMMTKYKNAGYKLYSGEGTVWPDMNYQFYIDSYGEYLSKEVNDYLAIKESATAHNVVSDAAFIVTFDELATRIMAQELFLNSYPQSKYFNEIKELNKLYLAFYFFGVDNTLSYNYNTKVIRSDALNSYNTTIATYPGTKLATLTTHWKEKLANNNNKFSNTLKNEMQTEINQ